MNIILEGPDNAGKTTLAGYLQRALQWPLKDREGKPPTWQAAVEKARRYLALDGYIIDRHVVVSQSIYGNVLRDDLPLPAEILGAFINQNNIIIYCRCIEKGLEGHEPTVHEAGIKDTVDHVVELERKYHLLVQTYDAWAVRQANIIYNDYGQIERVISMVRGIINERETIDG